MKAFFVHNKRALATVGLLLSANAPSITCTVDVTPRRLQTFSPSIGDHVRYQALSVATGELLKTGTMLVDAQGLATILAVPVSVAGTRLTLAIQRQ